MEVVKSSTSDIPVIKLFFRRCLGPGANSTAYLAPEPVLMGDARMIVTASGPYVGDIMLLEEVYPRYAIVTRIHVHPLATLSPASNGLATSPATDALNVLLEMDGCEMAVQVKRQNVSKH